MFEIPLTISTDDGEVRTVVIDPFTKVKRCVSSFALSIFCLKLTSIDLEIRGISQYPVLQQVFMNLYSLNFN